MEQAQLAFMDEDYATADEVRWNKVGGRGQSFAWAVSTPPRASASVNPRASPFVFPTLSSFAFSRYNSSSSRLTLQRTQTTQLPSFRGQQCI